VSDSNPELEQRLADAWAAGQAAWPTVHLDAERFTQHVRARLPEDKEPVEALAQLACVDLYLACACLHALPSADLVLERSFLAAVDQYVRRVDASPAFADEVRQLLREKLLLASEGKPPKIGEYAGSGPLSAWLRVVAVRTALNLRRDSGNARIESLDDAMVAAATDKDAELEHIKERYRDAFQQAVREALGRLPDEQRRAMRLHLVGRLTTAKIGQMFQVNQSTVVRWLAVARIAVREHTRDLLKERLQLSSSEFDSLTNLLLSRLDVSMEAALRTIST
jgi:RNA polymerase sigma-70 factor, ECF subfamily